MSPVRTPLGRFRAGAEAVRRRGAQEDGISLVELMMVLLILVIIVGGMTTLFVSASTSQIDQSNRYQAQQNARLALKALRREIRCSKAITPTQQWDGSMGTWPSASAIKITLGTYCPTVAGAVVETEVTWCTRAASVAGPWTLYRISPAGACAGGTERADELVTDYPPAAPTVAGKIFSHTTPAPGSRPTLSVSLPVDVTPASPSQRYWLKDDIVLRNVPRS